MEEVIQLTEDYYQDKYEEYVDSWFSNNSDGAELNTKETWQVDVADDLVLDLELPF